MPDDEALMVFLSSVNIACGGHTGDESSMQKTVSSAKKNNLSIGAHPSFPDRKNFGRMDLIEKGFGYTALSKSLAAQILALEKVCSRHGAALKHVKPHGALYNRACVDHELALLISEMIREINPQLYMVGMSATEMEKAAAYSGLRFVREAFADRKYLSNGLLRPRSAGNALIENPDEAAEQALRLVQQGIIMADTGEPVQIKADSICIHGDGRNAVVTASKIHAALSANGIMIKSAMG